VSGHFAHGRPLHGAEFCVVTLYLALIAFVVIFVFGTTLNVNPGVLAFTAA
jgi:hypothetical protein